MKNFLKNIFNTRIKQAIILIVLLCLYILTCAYSYVMAVSNDIEDSVFRLHVIANSDSQEDQDLKYKVRDAVLAYMNNIAKDCKSKEETIALANEHTEAFRNIAKQVIEENGYSYDVSVKIGNFSFPTKTYGDISLPAGYYDALRIEIGSASGKNWWCVMFPPLCFVDVTSGIVPEESKDVIKSNLSEEEYRLVSETNDNTQEHTEIKFKFKLIEMLQNVKIFTAKK